MFSSLLGDKFPSNFYGFLSSFNSIANTSLMKTMTKIVNIESQTRKDFKTPSKDALDLLATSSAGDIRACINSLQFYCTNGKIFIPDSYFNLSKDMSIFSSRKDHLF